MEPKADAIIDMPAQSQLSASKAQTHPRDRRHRQYPDILLNMKRTMSLIFPEYTLLVSPDEDLRGTQYG